MQCDNLNPNPAAAKLHEVLFQDILHDIEMVARCPHIISMNEELNLTKTLVVITYP